MRLVLVVLLAAPWPALADVSPSRTPSGNIDCTIGTGEGPPDLRCTIHERSGPPAAPQPASCQGPWGHHFTLLSRGPVVLDCGPPGPKATSPGVDVAEYGLDADWGGIACSSSASGLSCTNADGHGFFLSRARQSVY